MLLIRGTKVDYFTIQRWVYKFTPVIEVNMHLRKRQVCSSWRMDETYIEVGGKDRYLYRAVDKYGNTIDFLLTKRRIAISAGFKDFESAQRTLAGIEIINIIRKNQIKDSNPTVLKHSIL